MTIILALVIWVTASAVLAPVIGHFLFAMRVAYPVAQPASMTARPVIERGFARRRATLVRRPLVQSKFG